MTTKAGSVAPVEAAAGENDERALRVELAACYRLLDRFGMTDLIYTHVSARIGDESGDFLLNRFGLRFDEITASNLVRVTAAGEIAGGEGPVNPAGFVIHGAILGARPDIVCALHTHTRAGVAVSALACGLLPISQHALQFYQRIGYHDYEGFACDDDERRRLAADLGPHNAMILRNHGLMTVGRSVGEAFLAMFNLEQACRFQIDALHTGADLVVPPPEVCDRTARQFEAFAAADKPAWAALVRALDRDDPSFRD
jgi:ribulose-5-phosphate 4-epimerase/fuculose-1-phosphate aldolase